MAKKVKTSNTVKRGKPALKPARAAVSSARKAPVAKKAAAAKKTPAAPKARMVKTAAGSSKKPQAPALSAAVKQTPPSVPTGPYTPSELEVFKVPLIKLREQLNRRIHNMADDSLKNIDDTPSEDRTDDFDREFALNLVSTEHDVLFEIDDALRRIEQKIYGQCDGCTKRIEKIRLRALPFARMCVKCQSEAERGRTRFRPFGETLTQGAEATPEPAEVEETE